jgi:hypothetical protein
VEPSPLLLRPFIGLSYQPLMIDGDDCGAIDGMNEWKHAPVPLYSPQVPHDFTQVRTRIAAMGSRRLTNRLSYGTAVSPLYRRQPVTERRNLRALPL